MSVIKWLKALEKKVCGEIESRNVNNMGIINKYIEEQQAKLDEQLDTKLNKLDAFEEEMDECFCISFKLSILLYSAIHPDEWTWGLI